MTNKTVDTTRTPGRPRLVLLARASHTAALIRPPTIVTVSAPVVAALTPP